MYNKKVTVLESHRTLLAEQFRPFYARLGIPPMSVCCDMYNRILRIYSIAFSPWMCFAFFPHTDLKVYYAGIVVSVSEHIIKTCPLLSRHSTR